MAISKASVQRIGIGMAILLLGGCAICVCLGMMLFESYAIRYVFVALVSFSIGLIAFQSPSVIRRIAVGFVGSLSAWLFLVFAVLAGVVIQGKQFDEGGPLAVVAVFGFYFWLPTMITASIMAVVFPYIFRQR